MRTAPDHDSPKREPVLIGVPTTLTKLLRSNFGGRNRIALGRVGLFRPLARPSLAAIFTRRYRRCGADGFAGNDAAVLACGPARSGALNINP